MHETKSQTQVDKEMSFVATDEENRVIQPPETAFVDESNRLAGASSLSELFGVPGIRVAGSESQTQTTGLATPEMQNEVQTVDLAAPDLQNEIKTNSKPIASDQTTENLANQNTKTEDELRELKAVITARINAILANPEDFTSQQLGELQSDLLELMAGRNYQEFLQQENDSELSIALENLRIKIEEDQLRQKENVIKTSELLGIAAPESGEAVDIKPENIVDVVKDGEDKLDITIQDTQADEQQTISFKQLAILALFVTADMMIFDGNLSYAITSLGDTGTRLARLSGVDVSGRNGGMREEFSNQLVEAAEPRKLITFLEERKGNEMYRFLAGLSKDNRDKLLAGQRFGGLLGRHQLSPEQIEMVTKQLDENQKKEFNIRPKE
ncbi:MAG: hypothetical protein CO156_01535 [Candidatus Pacebacteria bacterium CG_4_9_14_3_um_filter_40_12]|uniref:Uncharacterized protein n=2 Tax=Patescibacteria group TaxID=1783273 RepID=A0A2H0NEN3_9BACT|nr:MAG: hypothetical protein COV55_00110 [Candidatus Komeilibacteria bacterium CG11_big_fil_rev_8_21_14_0_20_36_20]PIZ63025.1 MAG: hypothetical protein COY16_02955 [Candidatus Roizmanbacteria bacterium CG_4_10_14_0_2_um_filter_39_13]PJA69172.1 MAG: hypothetical protein CO156_01535 [Candidatus Pacebacteria bacterium CG_4_9_14_3_um_filter_40_12]PJC54158.1 MAG: hypothetical protein CO028_03905 [Candidatus Levybacteria bacterium CG_4_9_14_0_2_um_filter_35_21]